MIRTAKARRRRGATLIEFTLVGIPAIFICISIVTTSIDMWQFFTLSYAAGQTARYAALHGITCTKNGNSCTVTRAQLATFFEHQALALMPASTTMTLNDGSGAVTCNPINSCPSGSSTFPSTGNNSLGGNVVVSATYRLIDPIFLFWPSGGSVSSGRFTVGATSTQEILF